MNGTPKVGHEEDLCTRWHAILRGRAVMLLLGVAYAALNSETINCGDPDNKVTSTNDHRTVSKGGTMRWIAGLLLMGMAHAALASGPPTFDKFQSAVESKGAPPEGTFFTTGKFKSLCTCLDHTGDVGVIESSTSTMGTNVLVTAVCVLSAFNATTGAIATQALCDTWAPITKP